MWITHREIGWVYHQDAVVGRNHLGFRGTFHGQLVAKMRIELRLCTVSMTYKGVNNEFLSTLTHGNQTKTATTRWKGFEEITG